ncbi:MAG: hypothetical protein PUD03_02890 [Lachnospiraceae bacterium]|nr:hypothetical protein [Lachnospiraceae bacterium]MDD5853033.1 hypothetical protein [Lachnospiraceae bacterium]
MKNMSFKKDPGKKYDENARNVAKRKCFIIYLVVAYILYQSYGIIQSKLQNETTMSWAGAIVGAGILVVGSLAVAVIATLRMGRELAASEITEETVEADNPETNEEDIDQNPQINEEDTDQNSQSNEGNVVQNPENE